MCYPGQSTPYLRSSVNTEQGNTGAQSGVDIDRVLRNIGAGLVSYNVLRIDLGRCHIRVDQLVRVDTLRTIDIVVGKVCPWSIPVSICSDTYRAG